MKEQTTELQEIQVEPTNKKIGGLSRLPSMINPLLLERSNSVANVEDSNFQDTLIHWVRRNTVLINTCFKDVKFEER